MRRGPLWLAPLLLGACAQQVVVFPDAGESDDAGAATDAGVARDAGSPGDAGDRDSGPADTGGSRDAGPPDSGLPACYANAFDDCPDPAEPPSERNDSWTDASRYHTTSVGCIQGDDLSPLDTSRSGRICASEDADYYALTVVPCDSLTLRMEVRLRMAEVCPSEKYELRLLYGGGLRDCGEDFDGTPIECLEDGPDRIIRVVIPPANTVHSWYFAVVSEADDIRYDYDLEVFVR